VFLNRIVQLAVGLLVAALQLGFVGIWQSGLHLTNPALDILIQCIYVSNKVLPLLAIFALSYKFLNRPNETITRLNPYVFPLYILHQSVIILVAYLATNSRFTLLQNAEYQLWFNLVVTPLVCAFLLSLIAKVNGFRMCFGMRLKSNRNPYDNWRISVAVLVICTPMIFRLI
jgi:hypothetical protein